MDIILTVNNYFHDVATGLLLVSGLTAWILIKSYPEPEDARSAQFLLRTYRSVAKTAKIAFFWIIIGGIPRTIFYKRLEWASAVGNTQIWAIAIKHVLVFACVGMGIYYIHQFNKKIRAVRRFMVKQG